MAPAISKDAGAQEEPAPIQDSSNDVERNKGLNVEEDDHSEQGTGSCPINPPTCRLWQAARVEAQTSDCEEGKVEGLCNGMSNGVKKASLTSGKAIFLCKSWRSQLCQCSNCLEMYKSRELDFLFKQGDSLHDYEEVASQRRAETLANEEGAQRAFLDKLGHVQQIELLHGINDMTRQLVSFLVSFYSFTFALVVFESSFCRFRCAFIFC